MLKFIFVSVVGLLLTSCVAAVDGRYALITNHLVAVTESDRSAQSLAFSMISKHPGPYSGGLNYEKYNVLPLPELGVVELVSSHVAGYVDDQYHLALWRFEDQGNKSKIALYAAPSMDGDAMWNDLKDCKA